MENAGTFGKSLYYLDLQDSPTIIEIHLKIPSGCMSSSPSSVPLQQLDLFNLILSLEDERFSAKFFHHILNQGRTLFPA